MRGGLDDALDTLARRDELRRRAAGEATGTPPAVTELVEAIAAVVGRHPGMGLTVGVDGVGEPLLLHFFFADGQVQVNAEAAAAATPGSPGGPRHADFDVDADEPGEPTFSAPPAGKPTFSGPPASEPVFSASPGGEPVFSASSGGEPVYSASSGGESRRVSQDDQDRFGPVDFGYAPPSAEDFYPDSDTAERRYGSLDPTAARDVGESSRDLGARMRDLGMASTRDHHDYPPHPFAATPPPPVPPQTTAPAPRAMPPRPRPATPPSDPAQPTRRIQPEQYRAPAEPAAAERISGRGAPGTMPAPLAKPIPLQVERPEETEMAARRLAALLRDDPTLLRQPE